MSRDTQSVTHREMNKSQTYYIHQILHGIGNLVVR